MAPANFQERIERIQKAHQGIPEPRVQSVRAPGMAAVAAARRPKRRNNPVREHMNALSMGIVLGTLAAVAQLGHEMEGAPWGPGGEWYAFATLPILGSLALAPILLLMSLIIATRRPGFALFSLGYLSGIIIPLFV